MKKIFTVFILIAFFGLGEAIAQKHVHNWCGITPADEEKIIESLVRNRSKYPNRTLTRMPARWTPIKIHIINKDDGTGGISPIEIFEMMCSLNEAYLDQDIQFFVLDDFNYINSTTGFTNPGNINSTLLSNRVSDAINLYISKGINGAISGSGTLGYYSPNVNYDWLVMRQDQINSASTTVIHEMGHYFDVMHPFYGWPQNEGYDVTQYGNPAPPSDPMNRPTELMDGSNCLVSGDMLCDTPPNYNVALGANAGCNYDGTIMDPNGVPLDPAENNYMDYFLDGCQEEFTDDQKVVILNKYDERTNIHTNEDFDVTEIDEPEMIYPINGETTPSFASVEFEWEAVPGATSYVLEIDELASFVLDPQAFIVTDNFMEVQGIFEINETYYWRVKAIKDGYYCSPIAESALTGKFKTGVDGGGTSTNEISEVIGYTIAPNPVGSNQTLNINLKTSKGFDAQISLFNLSGQTMRAEEYTFDVGNANYSLPVNGLAEGMYILSIETESGVLNEKIVIRK